MEAKQEPMYQKYVLQLSLPLLVAQLFTVTKAQRDGGKCQVRCPITKCSAHIVIGTSG
jgi:hypothetical protein